MTQSPDVLQEAALREALEAAATWFRFHGSTGEFTGEYCTVKPHDTHGMVPLVSIETALSALSLPQQAATDEREAKAIFLAAHADGWRGNQLRRDVQHVDAEKSWELFVSNGALGKILSTPTSQPPAAETRLREAVHAVLCESNGLDDAHPAFRYALDQLDRAYSAALTQPELTAQQAIDNLDLVRSEIECLYRIRKADGDTSRHDEAETLRAICLEALSAQQAARKVEAVAWQRNHPVQGWIDCRQEDVAHYARQGQQTRPLYATPQPTETQRIVAALEKVMPIRVNDGPDYAEVYFADGSKHSTQAMTMNPQDWLDLQAAYDAVRGEHLAGEGDKA